MDTLRLFERLKAAGMPEDAARAIAEEIADSMVTKANIAQSDEIREAKTEARIARSEARFAFFLAIAVVGSGVVGRLIWGG
jgi:hypothetical protein